MAVRYQSKKTGSIVTYAHANARLERDDRYERVDLHVCDTCGFEAKTAGGLTAHERTHDA